MSSNYEELLNEPVEKLINKYIFSTITALLITQIYNVVDNYFIGKINTQASAAVGISMSIMVIIQAIGFMFGQGSGNAIALYLGKKDLKKASEIASLGFFGAIFLGLMLTIFGNIFIVPISRALGSTDTVLPYVTSYLRIILIGAFYHCATLVLNIQLRCQGKAFYSMVGLMAGAVLNMALDPILIFKLNLGIKGAALATAISQLISFLIIYNNSKKFDVKISINNLHFNREYANRILKGGIPSLTRQSVNSIGIIALNNAAAHYGDSAIAAMGIVNRIGLLANSVIIGYGHAFQPICGYNYSANRYDRVLKGFWYELRQSTIFLVVVSIIMNLFAPQIIDIFIDDIEVIKIGATTLRYYTIFLTLNAFMILATLMMQTIQMAFQSSVLSMLRMGLILIPIVAILPKFIGILGIQLAQPIVDIISFVCTLVVTKHLIDDLERKKEETLNGSLQV
ncbi:putative efflux protein, MATE family [Peptoniphilus asaccharolyticus DSM 20463]|uniref:Multidrug export protein MepA n=1 Tax=Peptoniphilus asaccharolyticus DSM 20463 TaxID=573058 RepID=A0A1W1VEI0_PEPAS|nr:MATE family efflux transporter [Peptoniphilus asaccharolyticus]MBL7575929.1 MATE family efflux transporter [Peptoniphilus asaccharolyticus]SMB91837.1 putative efflux protein, MATE family [Peptoniphilus asaccharolyticus DSM 20463]